MPSSNQTEKEMSHLFFNIFELDPKDEKESIFMSILSDLASKHALDAIALLLHECLRRKGLNLPIRLAMEVKSIKFCLQQLQE